MKRIISTTLMVFIGISMILSGCGNKEAESTPVNKHAKENVNETLVEFENLEDLNEKNPYGIETTRVEGGRVKSIRGSLSRENVENVEEAKKVLESLGMILDVEDVRGEFELSYVQENENVVLYTFAQKKNGISVLGSALKISVDKESNQTIGMTGFYLSDTAAKLIDANTGDKSLDEVMIFALDDYENAPILVYEEVTDQIIKYISISDDQVICEYEQLETAREETGNEKKFKDKYRKLSEDKSIKDTVTIPGKGEVDICVYNADKSSITNDNDAIDILKNLKDTVAWYGEHFGRYSVDNQGKEIMALVHCNSKNVSAPMDYDNGAWHPTFREFWFFDDDPNGGMGKNTDKNGVVKGWPYEYPAGRAYDVAVHEFTHGVFQYEAGGGKEVNIDPAIKEGYSDVFAYFADGYDDGFGENWMGNGYYYAPADTQAKFGYDTNQGFLNIFRTYSTDPGPLDLKTWHEKYITGITLTLNGAVSDYSHSYCLYVSHAAYLMEKIDGLSHEQLEKIWYNSMKYFNTGDFLYEDMWSAIDLSMRELKIDKELYAQIKQVFTSLNLISEYIGPLVDMDALTNAAANEKQEEKIVEQQSSTVGIMGNLYVDIAGIDGLYVDEYERVALTTEMRDYLESYGLDTVWSRIFPFGGFYELKEAGTKSYSTDLGGNVANLSDWCDVESWYNELSSVQNHWCHKETIKGVDFIFSLERLDGYYYGMVYYKDSNDTDPHTKAYEMIYDGDYAPDLPSDFNCLIGFCH